MQAAAVFRQWLDGELGFNQPWHIFRSQADWQSGSAELLIASRKKNVPIQDYRSGIVRVCQAIKGSGGLVDGAVVFASEDWLLYWQHCPAAASPLPSFAAVADTACSQSARPTGLEASLDVAWDGFPITGGEFFNMQFPVP